ncbi:c-type cytochrome [Seonamhaeicola maritimus]|uniref:c-type cytochrome n=1 Tax=Seonamhaeicola maritimus TaxID=2591822 RepID=UPI002494CFD4|nr:c-type cytochrome [Seonamhaeicola maritimus]
MNRKKTFINTIIYLLLTSCICILSSCQKNQKKVVQENIEKGQMLFNSVGCINCHSVTGEDKLYGPSLKYSLGSEVTVLRDSIEHVVTINRDYIKRSISNPDFEKLIGYQSSKMAKTTLTPNDIDFIVEYLISINNHN